MDDSHVQLVASENPRFKGHPAEYHDIGFTAYIRHNGNLTHVANELGISRDSVGRWARREDWKGRVERAKADLTEAARREVETTLAELAPKAIQRLAHIMDNAVDKDGHPQDAIRMRAANSLLDRAGYPAIQRMLIDQRIASMSVTSSTADAGDPLTPEQITATLVRIMSDDTKHR